VSPCTTGWGVGRVQRVTRVGIAALLAVVVAASGCGGSEPAPDESPTEDAATSGEPSPGAVEGTADDDPGAVGDEPLDVTDDPADGLLTAPASVSAPIGVEYRATGDLVEEFTIARSGDVMAFTSAWGRIVMDGASVVVCAAEGCTRLPDEFTGADGPDTALADEAAAAAAATAWASGSDVTIAGRPARCLSDPGAAEADLELTEYCFDVATGMPLRWTLVTTDAGGSVEAVRVFEPTADDLAPTGPVTEMDLPPGFQMPDEPGD